LQHHVSDAHLPIQPPFRRLLRCRPSSRLVLPKPQPLHRRPRLDSARLPLALPPANTVPRLRLPARGAAPPPSDLPLGPRGSARPRRVPTQVRARGHAPAGTAPTDLICPRPSAGPCPAPARTAPVRRGGVPRAKPASSTRQSVADADGVRDRGASEGGRQARASSPAPAACLPTFNTVSLTSSFPSNTPSVPSPAAFRRTGIWIQAGSTNRPCGRTSEPIGPLAALHSEVGRQYSMDVSPRNRPPTGGAPAPAPREMRAGLRRAGVRGVWEGCVRPVRTECARPVHACRRRVGRAGWGES
jgi:hypothetical protein